MSRIYPQKKQDRNTILGFGEFLVDTSSWLSSDAVKQLVLLFGFSVTEGDRIGGDNVKLINSLRKRGLISPTDISQLIHALEKINLQGVATKVQDSFEKLHGRGQKPRTMQGIYGGI
ncbi:hypothetical protein HOLleu_02610 [Holothuria leucospilota]|uniref:Uncharacterized protein n=1 Tax=Holothuria leucospilota TaxID=206669 RepID=A0A9Q1CRV3_HOLLE|nr:hypothetical protein HOLleu_02610 [Holothuria leucospilota]